MGIEPTPTVLETVVLPLNYTPIQRMLFKEMEGGRFELPNPKERIYSPPRLATSLSLHHIKKWSETDSNRRHLELQSSALPTELPGQSVKQYCGHTSK